MQISSFNGGLNKRVSPYLMQSNEGVKYSNIDTTTGALAPLKENKNLNANIKPNFTYFNNHWVDSDENRDYVKFQEKLFYSNGQTRPQWSKDGFTWYGLGIDKPAKAPEVSSNIAKEYPNSIEPSKDGSSCAVYYKTQGFSEAGVYELIIVQESVVDSNIKTKSYVKFSASLNSGSVIAFSYPTTVYIKYPSDTTFYKHTSLDKFYMGSDYIENGVGDRTRTSETFDFKNKIIQDSTNLNNKAEFVLFVKKSGESVYSDTYVKNIDLNLSYGSNWDNGVYIQACGCVKYFILETPEEYDDIMVFYNNVRVYAEKLTSNKLKWFIKFDLSDITLTQFIENNSVESIGYVYTYYSEDGMESSPSEESKFPLLLSPTLVKVLKSSDPQVTSIKLYRRGAALTQYSLVTTLPNKDIEYADSLSDSEIDGAVLNSYNNLPAPDGLQYLTLYNTMLFGSIDDKLYYTDVATPFVWSGFNFIDFDDTITGIGGTPNGLLVFTKHSTYIVTGTSPDTFSKYLLSSGVGCVLHKSIQSLHNSLIWLSDDSICVSSGGEIQSISRDKLDTLNFKTPRCSAVLNDVYYVSHNQGTLIADFRFGLVFRESDKVYYGLAVKDNTLYGVESDDSFVEINKGEATLALHYLSPKFSDGSISTLKTYKDIYFHSTGDLSVKVFIDDTLVGSKSLAEGFDEIKVSSEKTQGYSIQFEVEGKGTLNEIEYKIESRQNGR